MTTPGPLPSGDAPRPDVVTWFKSSRSGANGNCVEVARFSDAVAVRDSKHPTGPALEFTVGQWAAFVAGIKQGEFDVD